MVSARAWVSSCFPDFVEKLRPTGSMFPDRGGEGPNVLAIGLLFSKAAIRDLTETLGTAREARCVEGRAWSSTFAVSGATDCS
jgi:hypothetical protein